MLRSLDASRGNTPALALAGQLLYAKMDLAVHTDPERSAAGPLDAVDAAVAGDMDYFKDFKRTGKLRTARHLFSSPAGYASSVSYTHLTCGTRRNPWPHAFWQ